MYTLNSIGEEITPPRIGAKVHISELTFVTKEQLSRYDLKYKVVVESFLAYVGDQGAKLFGKLGRR